MRIFLLSFFSLLVVGLFAQAYEGPYPEITNGYGAFGNHPITEKKFDNQYLLDNGMNHGDGGVEITIRYASDVQGPMPTVLFASGWNQYDPATFNKILDFIASKGFCVVFTPYPTDQTNHTWANSLYYGMKQAIDENSGVNAGDLNIIEKSKIGFFGHSLGAGDIYWLGHKFYVDHGYGSNGKFLFVNSGWIGFNMTEAYLADYPSDCLLRVQVGQEEDYDPNSNPTGDTSPRIQYYLFHQINIPDSNKNYVRILSADQNNYHYSTHHDMVTSSAAYNALDYYAIFRPLDAMMDYAFNGETTAKDIALGIDKSMGSLPDLDGDYNTFVFAHPESSYNYQCAVDGNPFKDQCPAAPLPIEVLEPLSARLEGRQVRLAWATAMEHNNKGFGIQRSKDGLTWTEIGWVEGQGTTSVAKEYRVVDSAPKEGINYYRYEQVDYDGHGTFSNVVSVSYESLDKEMRLAPNPAVGEVAILSASADKVDQVVIRTLAGKTVKTFGVGANHLDVSGLQSGAYVVFIQVGGVVVEKMLMVL